MHKWDNVNINKYKFRFHGYSCFKAFFGTNNGLAYEFDTVESINNVQFNVNSLNTRFSYSIESSLDGCNWKTNAEFSDCGGKQNVYFPMQEMKYLYIKLNLSGLRVKKESVVLMLDTKSGERRNKTS